MAIDIGILLRGSSISTYGAGSAYLSKALSAKPSYKDLSSPQALNSDLVTLSKDQSIGINALEKHLDDVSKGKGYLSKEIDSQLGDLDQNSSALLAANDPKSVALYSAYSTAFTYNERAHFVNSIADTASALNSLSRTVELSKSSDAIAKSIVDLYSPKESAKTAEPATTDPSISVLA